MLSHVCPGGDELETVCIGYNNLRTYSKGSLKEVWCASAVSAEVAPRRFRYSRTKGGIALSERSDDDDE